MKISHLKKYLPLITFAVMIFFSACTDQNSATPNVDDRDKFIGSWICKETIGTSSSSFTVDVSKYGSGDSIYLKNFSNYGTSANALGLISGNSLTIPNQTIGITNIPVGGTGVYSGSTNTNEKITANYSTDGQTASAIFTRH